VNMEIWWHESCQGKQKYSGKTLPSATLSATDPTRNGFGMNLRESNFSNSRMNDRFCCMELLGYGAYREFTFCVADGYIYVYRYSLGKFYISLTVHLGAVLVNNQLDALFQCIYLFHFSTCFE
jgi:hypothetical protein